MDTNKIKMFLLTEKYKSFSKTAEEFSYTPSAISHIADSLEEELGVKLFIRSRKGVELTEAGLKQIKAAKRIEAEIESVAELLDEYISAVKNDENFKKMDSYLQNACIDYYFNKEISETKINDKYHITGFVKKIYRQLHKF